MLLPIERRKERLTVQELTQLRQRAYVQSRLRLVRQALAEVSVQHPDGDGETDAPSAHPHEHAVGRAASEATQDLDLVAAERVVPIVDCRKSGLMGIMMMD